MTHLLQTGLDLFVRNFPLPPDLQNSALKFASSTAPLFLTFNKKEITFDRHPLHSLYHLLRVAIQGQQATDLSSKLQEVPEHLRNDLYFEVWSQATEHDKGGDKWGERNALNNLPRLLNAIKTVVEKRLASLPGHNKNSVYGTIYRMANLPSVQDDRWGEHHAQDDTERLIRALHRNMCLDMPGTRIYYFRDLEKHAKIPSQPFHLYRPEIPRGQICLINGMGTTFNAAKEKASKLSDDSAQGYNIHCIYSASSDPHWDVASAILGQGGSATPAVLELLEQWQDFFESDENARLLQLCTSRGAIEVNNALTHLPQNLRQRIIVIAIAPACLIPSEMAYKVANLVILADPVVQVALNRQLINEAHVIKLNPHLDNPNPHDMNGASYRDWLTPRIDTYIRTNDLQF